MVLQPNATFKGGGGADTITISGDSATTAFVAGNGGADLISFSGVSDGLTIAGGSGNDTIELEENFAGQSALIMGGADADSIYINDVADGDTDSALSVEGGAGADSITLSATTTGLWNAGVQLLLRVRPEQHGLLHPCWSWYRDWWHGDVLRLWRRCDIF